MFYVRRKSENPGGMEIRGGREFQRRTGEALALLQSLSEFEMIHAHLAIIRQGTRSGITAWAERPVFTVGAPTWNHSALWYASAIAHDAYHAKLYRDAKQRQPDRKPRVSAWSGNAAERICLAFQRDVLLSLNANKTIIEYLETHLQNPTYQGRSGGWRGWLDYRKRWW
jgi:hypothetical protein